MLFLGILINAFVNYASIPKQLFGICGGLLQDILHCLPQREAVKCLGLVKPSLCVSPVIFIPQRDKDGREQPVLLLQPEGSGQI